MKRNEQIDGTEFACLTINADLEAENEKLNKQLALTEKALELACYKLTDFESTEKESMHSSQYWYDYFKQQAEKELKNEITK